MVEPLLFHKWTGGKTASSEQPGAADLAFPLQSAGRLRSRQPRGDSGALRAAPARKPGRTAGSGPAPRRAGRAAPRARTRVCGKLWASALPEDRGGQSLRTLRGRTPVSIWEQTKAGSFGRTQKGLTWPLGTYVSTGRVHESGSFSGKTIEGFFALHSLGLRKFCGPRNLRNGQFSGAACPCNSRTGACRLHRADSLHVAPSSEASVYTNWFTPLATRGLGALPS